MNVTMWILTIYFGGYALWTAVKWIIASITITEMVLAFIAVIFAAFAIGFLADPGSFHQVIER